MQGLSSKSYLLPSFIYGKIAGFDGVKFKNTSKNN